MAYTPKNTFINGKVADADAITEEFLAISDAFSKQSDEVFTSSAKNIKEAKGYTDERLATLSIDGGTF